MVEKSRIVWDYHETIADHWFDGRPFSLFLNKNPLVHYPRKRMTLKEWKRVQEFGEKGDKELFLKLFVQRKHNFSEYGNSRAIEEIRAERGPLRASLERLKDLFGRSMYMDPSLYSSVHNREFLLPYPLKSEALVGIKSSFELGFVNSIVTGTPGDCVEPFGRLLEKKGLIEYLDPEYPFLLKNPHPPKGLWVAKKVEPVASTLLALEFFRVVDGQYPKAIVNDVEEILRLASELMGVKAFTHNSKEYTLKRKRYEIPRSFAKYRKYKMVPSYGVPLHRIAEEVAA